MEVKRHICWEEGGKGMNAQVRKRHTAEMLRKKFKLDGGGLPWWLRDK